MSAPPWRGTIVVMRVESMIPAKPASTFASTKLPILIIRTLTPLSAAPTRLPPVAIVWSPHRVQVRTNLITVKGGKAAWNYTLNEPQQGTVAVRLTLGTAQGWCAAAPAKLPASTNDKIDRFVGAPKAGAPVSCPPTP